MGTEKKVTIIDVRSPAEFMGGNVLGSINIPLQELAGRLNEIKSLEGDIVLCCASGNRSGQAERYLHQNGIANCTNGGSWMDVQYNFFNN
jgi:rhodanese-related sulfurtransferase